MSMYLLRTVLRVKDENGKKSFVSDNWYNFDTYEELIQKVYQVDPDEYQCFESKDITNDIFFTVEKMHAEKQKELRRLQYLKLKKEFQDELA